MEITHKLQGKIIRILNKILTSTTKVTNVTEQTLRAYIASGDADYRIMPMVRSFYDRVTSSPNKFIPISYIISGKDVGEFNDLLAKQIGK